MPAFIPDTVAEFDLHLHTCWSYDTTAEAEMHFRRAAELGVRCIAITEHHNMDSLSEVQAAAAKYPQVRWIPAAELTVTTPYGNIDLLCYGLPVDRNPIMGELLAEYRRWQQEAGAAISAGMQKLGFDFTDQRRLELLQTYRPPRAIDVQGVTHVKNGVLLEHYIQRGYVKDEAGYNQLRAEAAKQVANPPYPAVERVVRAVHEVGGLIAIAHPVKYFLTNDRQRMDGLRELCALDGIECAHPAVDPQLTPLYESYCREHDLLPVGGSDCHSESAVQSHFARHIGKPQWLDELHRRLEP